jgi:hypothetical protein
MLRHVALFRWSESTTDDDVAAIEEGLSRLPGAIPEIRTFRFGRDAGINEGAFDFGIVADFDSTEDYVVYRDHPTHTAFLAERIAPHRAERAFIQYEC